MTATAFRPRPRLTQTQAAAIVTAFANGHSAGELSIEFACHRHTIEAILRDAVIGLSQMVDKLRTQIVELSTPQEPHGEPRTDGGPSESNGGAGPGD